jgi:DNA-directed RNA polymerase specialized sigma24 family protein
LDTVTIEISQFKQMLNSLERINNMLALSLIKDCKNQKEKIIALSSYGYSPKDIATLLKTTSNTVRNALSRAKNDGKDELEAEEGKVNE